MRLRALCLVVLLVLAGCAENPVTGRREFVVVSEEQAIQSPAVACRGLWEKMTGLGEAKPPEFLSTHPSPENWRQRLQALARKLEPVYEAAKRT